MANNPYVNKVIYGNDTIMDISDSTITPNNILMGYEGYDASGNKIEGKVGVKYEDGYLVFNGPLYSYENGRVVIGNYVDNNGILNLT